MVGVCLGAAGYCLKACYDTVFFQKSGIKRSVFKMHTAMHEFTRY